MILALQAARELWGDGEGWRPYSDAGAKGPPACAVTLKTVPAKVSLARSGNAGGAPSPAAKRRQPSPSCHNLRQEEERKLRHFDLSRNLAGEGKKKDQSARSILRCGMPASSNTSPIARYPFFR